MNLEDGGQLAEVILMKSNWSRDNNDVSLSQLCARTNLK